VPSLLESDMFVGKGIHSIKKFRMANGRNLPKVVFMLAANLLKHKHLKREDIIRKEGGETMRQKIKFHLSFGNY
jgi:hypothetical protein